MPRFSFFAVCALLASLLSCGGRESVQVPDKVVTVKIVMPAEPPPESEISIRVVEVSGPDRAIVGTLTAPATVGPFEVKCPANRIRDNQQYGLEITVVHIGTTVFRNKEPYLVLTKGNPSQVTATLAKI